MAAKQSPHAKAALDRIVEAIVYLSTESRRLARESAASHGLTATQVSVIKLLDAIGDLSLSSLSARIGANNSTVTGVIDRMERDGLVARERSADDRRVWLIRLTDRARRLAPALEVSPWDVLAGAIAALGARDKRQLLVLLGRVADNVRRTVESDGRPVQANNGGTR
ncbi:MAG TPA: MarR family transcriptional regulator [Myxococcota bacterium]|jgi:DNA-binding MarR family transcriptional regulator|nr:MarR family transcriptional regulator [Myxococcota bacterium]